MVSSIRDREAEGGLPSPSSSLVHDSAQFLHFGDIHTLTSSPESCVDVAISQETYNSFRTDSLTEVFSPSTVLTNATESNRPGPGRALDNLFQSSGRGLERLIYKVVKIYRAGKKQKPQEASLVLWQEQKSNELDGLSDNATASNRPGPGRLLDKIYQSNGRDLEKTLGKLADKAGFGPAAVERRVRSELMRCYDALLEVRDMELSQQRFDWINVPGTEAKMKKACRKLLLYTQSETPSTQLTALQAIQSLVGHSTTLRDCFIAAQAEILLHTLPKLVNTRNSAQIFYTDLEYNHILSESRRALYSVEDNEINRLAKRLSRRLTRRVDWTLMEGWTQLGPAFLGFLSNPTYAFLALRHLSTSLRILRYSFGAAGPDTTELQIALFNIMASIISSNLDLSVTFEHSVLECVLEDVLVIAFKCAIEYSRVGRERESLEYERFAKWLESAASRRGFTLNCEVETESSHINSQGDEVFVVYLSSSSYRFTGDARRRFGREAQ